MTSVIKEPPFLKGRLSAAEVSHWKDTYRAYLQKGGGVTAESLISSATRDILDSFWFQTKETVPDFPSYAEAKAQAADGTNVVAQEIWLKRMQMALNFNSRESTAVLPSFDSLSFRWLKQGELDREDLASNLRRRLENPGTYKTEENLQSSILQFRRLLEANGFKSISGDLALRATGRATAELSAEARGAFLQELALKTEMRIHQNLKGYRELVDWHQSAMAC
jgi:hypothetical protein